MWIWLMSVLSLLGILLPTPVEGFASWLKCYVDLDPSEVIMNHKVRPAEDAKYLVYIEVQPLGRGDVWLSSSNNIASDSTDNGDKDNNFVSLPPPFPGTPLTLRVRLHLPSGFEGSQANGDVQFVIEAKTSIADAAAESVEFIQKGIMCDGKRAFSRKHNEAVLLQIDLDSHPDLEYVTLTAGWASGVEAVTLTPPLTLKPSTTTTTTATGTSSTTTETIPSRGTNTVPTKPVSYKVALGGAEL